MNSLSNRFAIIIHVDMKYNYAIVLYQYAGKTIL